MNLPKIVDELKNHFIFQNDPFRLDIQTGDNHIEPLKNQKLCVITGGNTSGKSLLRKVLGVIHTGEKIEYIHLSQQGRSRGLGGLGVMTSMVYGSEDDESTGYNSTGVILGAIRTGIGREKPFSLMFDEPEIGCSEELAAAIGERLARDYDKMPNMVCMFVITHSRELARRLIPLNPTHIRMGDNLSLIDWVNRQVIPVDSLEKLKEEGIEKWRAVEKLINQRKKERK